MPPVACGGDDCDDTDAARYPGNTEICDRGGLDEDCDPSTFGERAGDAAIYRLCCNGVGAEMECGGSCAPIAATEACDRILVAKCNALDRCCNSDWVGLCEDWGYEASRCVAEYPLDDPEEGDCRRRGPTVELTGHHCQEQTEACERDLGTAPCASLVDSGGNTVWPVSCGNG